LIIVLFCEEDPPTTIRMRKEAPPPPPKYINRGIYNNYNGSFTYLYKLGLIPELRYILNGYMKYKLDQHYSILCPD
jgi:hypothetical protein